MGKVVAGINMTLDGFCDHTAGIADDALHEHYTELLRNSGVTLYGRTTYQLMEDYWPLVVEQPSGEEAIDNFALAIDAIPKVVFSHTLDDVAWESARVATRGLEEEVSALKRESDKAILIGSPSLIVQGTKLGLIDEYQLCVHPVILGKGLPLFKDISDSVRLKLLETKTFGSGVVLLYYQPVQDER